MDPLFQEEKRHSSLPILYPTLNEMKQKQRGCYWQPHEVSLVGDIEDWNKMNSDEQRFIKTVLAFFAASDLIINKNLVNRFINDVTPVEIQMVYRFQAAMEDIHTDMYAALIDTYISDPAEKDHLFAAVEQIPIIKKKAEWAAKWTDTDRPYNERLIAFAAIEGVFFSGSFCSIFWLKEKGILQGLTKSNDFIARDEFLHVCTACLIQNLLVEKADIKTVHEIIKEAVDLEIEFICEALPCKLIGINSTTMIEHIKVVANMLIKMLGYSDVLYPGAVEPFAFMERSALDGKSNFFEISATQYNKLAKTDNSDAYADI